MKNPDYSFYKEFIKKYNPQGFQNIDREDPFILDLENTLEENGQFFHIQDIIKLKVLFISTGIKNFIGVNPDEFDLSIMFSKLHQEDLQRYHLARTKGIKLGQHLLLKGKGQKVISSNFRINNGSGNYKNVLFQSYMFYSEIPAKTVYNILSFTDISHLDKGKHTYHYYMGKDVTNFRYPDKNLLNIGRTFSEREYEILKLIADGLDSEQIAERLFISLNTVSTHRRNLLKKANKTNTHELVIELKDSGVL